MTLPRATFLFLCFHLLAPLLYNTSDAALSSSILQALNCSTSGNYTTGGAYAGNLNQFLAALPENAVSKNGGFFNGTVGLGPDTVYGLAMCPADYSRADCGDCLAGAAANNDNGLPNRCPGSTTVLVMFDRCLIRYSNVNFFGTPDIGIVQTLSGQTVFTSTPGLYSAVVVQSFKDRTSEAMVSPQRFSASAGDPYTFVQCTWDLPADKCKQCLDALSTNASNVIAIRMDGQRKSFSCTVRYSNTSFMVVPFTPAVSGPTPQSVDQTGTSASPLSASGSKAATVGGAAIAVLVVISLAALIWYVYKLRRERHRDVLMFNYQQLVEATDNFADKAKLGAGGFGTVYKGSVMGIPEPVAIKKITDPTQNRATEDFDNEIEIMRPLNHRNILRLVGWCKDRSNLLLVYELMENGNLECQLYPKEGTMDLHIYTGSDRSAMPLLLDWYKRNNILVGIASGLLYLHSECKECLLHRDIKPGNVLLDKHFNAKLCDFGLVKSVSHNKTSGTTKEVRGSIGYIDPTYVTNGRASGKNDVYSFGILMLEVVCCEKPIVEGRNLIAKVWTCYESNEILNAAGRRLRGQYDDQIKRVLMLGLSCVQPEHSLRPHIRVVMQCLTGDTALLPRVSTLGFTPLTLTESGLVASTSHNNNSIEDGYNSPTVPPAQSGIVEEAGITPLLSGS